MLNERELKEWSGSVYSNEKRNSEVAFVNERDNERLSCPLKAVLVTKVDLHKNVKRRKDNSIAAQCLSRISNWIGFLRKTFRKRYFGLDQNRAMMLKINSQLTNVNIVFKGKKYISSHRVSAKRYLLIFVVFVFLIDSTCLVQSLHLALHKLSQSKISTC